MEYKDRTPFFWAVNQNVNNLRLFLVWAFHLWLLFPLSDASGRLALLPNHSTPGLYAHGPVLNVCFTIFLRFKWLEFRCDMRKPSTVGIISRNTCDLNGSQLFLLTHFFEIWSLFSLLIWRKRDLDGKLEACCKQCGPLGATVSALLWLYSGIRLAGSFIHPLFVTWHQILHQEDLNSRWRGGLLRDEWTLYSSYECARDRL